MKKLLRVLGRLFLALLFLAAAALVTLGLLRWRGLILLPDEADPDEWEVFGVDVSSYQGEVCLLYTSSRANSICRGLAGTGQLAITQS